MSGIVQVISELIRSKKAVMTILTMMLPVIFRLIEKFTGVHLSMDELILAMGGGGAYVLGQSAVDSSAFRAGEKQDPKPLMKKGVPVEPQMVQVSAQELVRLRKMAAVNGPLSPTPKSETE